MKYSVEHYNNKGHMGTALDLSRAELREELSRYFSDVPRTGCYSKAFDDAGRCIAFRHWDKKRITWIVKPTATATATATAPDYLAIVAELNGAIESALLRDDIAGDEIGDILRAALAKAESLQSFTI